MKSSTIARVRTAAPFLLWFRCTLPAQMQAAIRPHLGASYQTALKVLDSCPVTHALSVEEIAQRANLNRESTRQILHALRDGGFPFVVDSAKHWQPCPTPESPLPT